MGIFDKMKENSQAKKEKAIDKVVGKHLEDGESIELAIQSADSVGTLSAKMLVATNKRVLLVEREATSIVPKENVQSFNYANIESINASSGALSNVQLVAGVNTITLKKVSNKEVKPFVGYVNKKRSEVSTNTGTTIINHQSDKSVAEQLKEFKELLDMDIITEDEFKAKKAELLG